MARGRPRRAPPADPVDEPIPANSTEHFSPMLWMSHTEHRVCMASRESEDILDARSRYYGMQYYSLMDPYLRNLGLHHLVDIMESETKAINASLIAGLVEQWRPETHTFHLPFGEMTVTLQDVSALWGLPIQGVPVGGISDPTEAEERTINARLAELLGAQPSIRDNGGKSRYALKMTKLRTLFRAGLHWGSTQLEIERYTRGFVMDLFGSVMFADSNGDSIPMCYLELLRDLEGSRKYNWGGAVLAHLYYNLCQSCKPKSKNMYGPVLLLQHWSWSRLPVGVPEPNVSPDWGQPDGANCPAFGKKWYGHHEYTNQPHGKPIGIRVVRGQIQSLGDTQVIWTPYEDLYTQELLPQTVVDDQQMWFYRGPLVCFWIVEFFFTVPSFYFVFCSSV
ncbi:serine/threonine-protein phosphatase 7 long form homolog [Carex rostrata]